MDRTQGYYHDLETESESVRTNRQWQTIQAVVEKALSFQGEFRERLALAGIVADEIRSLDDFTSIPVLRKKDLSRLQREKGLSWFLSHAPDAFHAFTSPLAPSTIPKAGAQTIGAGPKLSSRRASATGIWRR